MASWKNKVFLVLAATLCGVLLFEAGLRVAGVSFPIFTQIDGDLGASLRSVTEGWWKKEGEAYIQINSKGLRDREHSLAKPSHTLRIAVLGDSYAEALQVPMEDAFWSVLERDLKQCPALTGLEPEVINFGVSGYGTAQELITLRHRVWSYSPDIVLLAFVTGNDVRNNSRVLEQDDKRPYFVFQNNQLIPDFRFRDSLGFRLRQTDVAQLMYRILNSSRIFQLVSETTRILKAHSARVDGESTGLGGVKAADKTLSDVAATPWGRYSEAGIDAMVYVEPQDHIWKEAWQVTERLLAVMRDEVREKGADFLVVTLSNGPQVHPDPIVRRGFEKHAGVPHLFYPDIRLRDLGEREGFTVLNLAPIFQTYAEEHQVFLHGFQNSGLGLGHWNNKGHRLAGQLISQKLCSNLAHISRGAGARDLVRDPSAPAVLLTSS